MAAPWRGGRKYITQLGLKKSCGKLKCNAVKMILGSREKGLLRSGAQLRYPSVQLLCHELWTVV